jgi:hypothetical protein
MLPYGQCQLAYAWHMHDGQQCCAAGGACMVRTCSLVLSVSSGMVMVAARAPEAPPTSMWPDGCSSPDASTYTQEQQAG